jgi:hypothetical protein
VTAGLDLQQAEAVGHLRDVEACGVGGVLLSGCVDRLPPSDARRLVYLLSTRVAPGGPVVLASTHPARWLREATGLERDLSPGRPLHPETWCYLLAEYGFIALETHDDPGLRTSSDPGPGGFLVTGARAG